jgi:hypothetical protein
VTNEEAIARLDAVQPGDPELSHGYADDVLLDLVHPFVAAAYRRLVARESWWASA